MSDDYLTKLFSLVDDHTKAIDQIVTRAKDDGDRELTDDEAAEVTSHTQAAEALVPQIQRWKGLREMRRSVADLRDATPTAPTQNVERTSGGDSELAGMTAGEITRIVVRAAAGEVREREIVSRALAQVTTVQTPALLPTVAINDKLVGKIKAKRPLIENGTSKVDMPESGMTWKVPKITQHTTVEQQVTEKTEVASRAFTVEWVEYTIGTYAGAVNMSFQMINRSSPSALDMVYADLAAQYGLRVEKVAADTFVAGIGSGGNPTQVLAADADARAFNKAIFAAAGTIYEQTSGELPDRIYASLDQWARLGDFVAAINPQDRQVTGVPTSFDMEASTIQVVVSAALPAGTLVLGTSDYFLSCEDEKSPVELKAMEVGILGWEVGVYGLYSAAITNPKAFVKLAA